MNALRSMVVAVAVGACALPVSAADEARGAAPVSAAPASGDPAGGSCATCGASGPTVGCSTCGKLLRGHARFGHKHKNEPFQVNLCPGACFGHFQTQWRKWEDVCPYPYIGHGATDAPRRPTPSALSRPGGELNPPRPIEPKKMPAPSGGGLPPIPDPLPKSKFGP